MKLAVKITLALVLGICVVMTYHQLAEVEEEERRHHADMQDDLLTVGRLFRPTLERTWRTEGKFAALYLLEYTKQTLREDERASKMDIRWVALGDDAPAGSRPRVDAAALEPLMRGRRAVSMEAASPEGEERLYSYVPLDVGMDGAEAGALEISESLAPLAVWTQHLRARAWRTVLSLVAVCAALTVAVGILFIALPTRKLAAAVERIGKGDLGVRVDLRQRDELGTLARGINQMCAQLAASNERLTAEHQRCVQILEQLRHADRLAVMGKLTAGLAHELGTPLAVVAGRASMIADGTVRGDEAVRGAENILRQVDKMTGIIRQTLDFSRQRKAMLVPCDLRTLAEETVTLLRPIAKKRGIELTVRAEQGARFTADMDDAQIQQVLSNLIVNAIDATDHGGIIVVGVERLDGELCCYVQDPGKGIPPEQRARIFEPFFTTKPPGKGTGLGLSVSDGIVREHGGRIELQSEVDRGTRFSVYIPVSTMASQFGTCSAGYSLESTRGRSTS